jgi:hypothetical protein
LHDALPAVLSTVRRKASPIIAIVPSGLINPAALAALRLGSASPQVET